MLVYSSFRQCICVDRSFLTYFIVDYLYLLLERWQQLGQFVGANVKVICISHPVPLRRINSSTSLRHQTAKQLPARLQTHICMTV